MDATSEETTRQLDRFSIVTLVFFVISIVFVIKSVRIPLPLIPLGDGRRLKLVIPLNLATAPVLFVFVLKAAQCIPWNVVRDGITGGSNLVRPFNILLFFFSLAYMAMSLDLTGVLQAAAFWVSNRGGTSGRRLYLYFYLMTTALSAVLGNDPVILSGTAFLVYFTKIAEVCHVAWIFSEFVTCNTASMLLFVGNPTNLVLCEGFSVNYLVFSAYTVFPFIACSVAGIVGLWIQFQKGHIPVRVTATTIDPRSVLLDPIGAIFGSLWLLVTLILITGTGFAGVQAYMISVPGAVSKAIFDIARDFYRTREQNCNESQPRRSINLEDGMHLHRVNSTADSTMNSPPEDIEAKVSVSQPTEENTREVNTTLAPDPSYSTMRIISLLAYVKEKSKGTKLRSALKTFVRRLPIFSTTLQRLPYALLPFAFAQFILVEALAYTGWITVFADWTAIVVKLSLPATIFVVTLISIILCNCSGTNIGATILLVKVLKHRNFVSREGFNGKLDAGGMLALAIGSNIGAVSFTFSASLAGLLWRGILRQKGIKVRGWEFAKWNFLPLICMTMAGCSVALAVVTVAPI